MRKLLISMLLIILLMLSLPWIMGYFIQASIDNALSALASEGKLQMTANRYQRGWQQSTVQLQAVVMQNQQPINVQIRLHIQHGPLLLTGKNLSWGQAAVNAEIAVTAVDRSINTQLSVNDIIHLDGDQNCLIQIPYLAYHLQSLAEINMKDIKIRANLANHSALATSMQIKQLVVRGAQHRVLLQDLALQGEGSLQQGLLNWQQHNQLAKLTLQGHEYPAFRLDAQLENVNLAALFTLLNSDTNLPIPANTIMQRLAWLNAINQVFGKGAIVALNAKQANNTLLIANLSYPNLRSTTANSNLSANVSITLPKPLIQDCLAIFPNSVTTRFNNALSQNQIQQTPTTYFVSYHYM